MPHARVIEDPEPHNTFRSPWRTYRACLQAAAGDHACILQDDTEPCEQFERVCAAAVAAQPDRLIALYVGGNNRQHAAALWDASRRGLQWAELSAASWVPAVALVWPRRLIRPCLEFVDQQGWPPAFRADDEIIGRFMRDLREWTLATVPSLVAHDDVEPSLVGQRHWGGGDPGRVAACQPDPACDLTRVDWTAGP